MSRRLGIAAEGGITLAETLAALALIAIALAISSSIMSRGRAQDRGIEAGLIKALAAERVMEKTLALPYRQLISMKVPLAPAETGGRSGLTAEVQVIPRGENLKEVVVTVRGHGRAMELRTLKSPWGAGP